MSYIPNTPEDVADMLAAVGVRSIEELLADVPPDLRLKQGLGLPPAMSEMELTEHLQNLADRNEHAGQTACFLGAGAYDHFIPAVVDDLAGRAEFYTAYTPYQPEASQGILQAFYEYQTCICMLTGMEVSNASLYDGATALAEACAMAHTITRRKQVVVPGSLHPEYRRTLDTYFRGSEVSLTHVRVAEGAVDPADVERAAGHDCACVVVQQPNFFGCLEDVEAISRVAHELGALLVACVNPMSLAILKPPGEYGADVAAGDGQPLGCPLAFGGPYFGFIATSRKYVRKMPGRIVGQTVDRDGRRAFALTLQTREQHIRRDKAGSNICTNHALMALRAAVYLAAMGESGLRRAAELCVQNSHYAHQRILALPGFRPAFDRPFFHEFVVRCPKPPEAINARLMERGIMGGLEMGRFHADLSDCLMFCATEKRTRQQIDHLVNSLKMVGADT